MRTLVWVTHSFRLDSRLTSSLAGPCTFVYYSPYYFAGAREKNIYKTCSQQNLDLFYSSLNVFSDNLANAIGTPLYVIKTADPIASLNSLIAKYGFTNVVIDKPLFSMWHGININNISCQVTVIDSDLVDQACVKLTAKSRWQSHIQKASTFKPYQFSGSIQGHKIQVQNPGFYPQSQLYSAQNVQSILAAAFAKVPAYGQTRDRHDGQTGISTALHNGVLDPANVFYSMASIASDESILRQLAFREISIIQARKTGLTLENTPLEWAKALMHHAAFDNLIASTPNTKNPISFDSLSACSTHDKDLNFLVKQLKTTGVMPNRARMYFASKVFYESASGLAALTSLIDTFDLLGTDGQSPNNYTQCCAALGLTYGKVLKMNRDRAFTLLDY